MQVWPCHPLEVGLEGCAVRGCLPQLMVENLAFWFAHEDAVSSQNRLAPDEFYRRLLANRAAQAELLDHFISELEESGSLEVAIVAVVGTSSAQQERAHSVLTTKLWLNRHVECELANFANEAAVLPRSKATRTHSCMHAGWARGCHRADNGI